MGETSISNASSESGQLPSMENWTPSIILAAVNPELSMNPGMDWQLNLALSEITEMRQLLRADHRRMMQPSLIQNLPGVSVPLWTFRLTGPLLVNGEDLRMSEEVSIRSLDALLASSKQFTMDLSKSPLDLHPMDYLSTSIEKAISIESAQDVITFGTIGMMRYTIQPNLLAWYTSHEKPYPVSC